MTKLQRLHVEHGQSPWLDNITRGYLTGGELSRMVEEGIRGVTSNPTIFQKAIAGHADYDEQFRTLAEEHESVQDAYWDLVIDDVARALELLRPVHDESGGEDGFVSIELAPALAADTDGSIAAARYLHERIDRPNLFVKIPSTTEANTTVRQMIFDGRNINNTLIFSLTRYDEVILASLAGMDACPDVLSSVRSVASFSVSRVDNEFDRRL